jgi:CHRD domain-containing protein
VRKLGRICGVAIVLMLATRSAGATTILFTGTLLGSSEVPPNASPATGTVSALLDDVADTLVVSETFSGLIGGGVTGAHIHCCAPPGTNAPIVLNFIAFGFPTGVTSGTYNHTFNLNTDLTGITTVAFINGMESFLSYSNIHDATFPGGEIRAQLTPEPGSMLLCATGLLAAARSLRRRRR